MECHFLLGGFWVSWPQQCWGCGKDGLEWLAPSRIAMFGEIPLLFGCHGHLTTARTAAICTLFCLAPQLKSPQLHQVFFFVEREQERERESPHIFPEAMLRSIFVWHCLGSAMFVAGEHHSFFAFQPRVVSRSIASESIVHFDILQMRKPKACERSGPKLPAEQVEPFGLWVSSALCHSYPVPRFTLCKSDLAMKHPPLGSWVC